MSNNTNHSHNCGCGCNHNQEEQLNNLFQQRLDEFTHIYKYFINSFADGYWIVDKDNNKLELLPEGFIKAKENDYSLIFKEEYIPYIIKLHQLFEEQLHLDHHGHHSHCNHEHHHHHEHHSHCNHEHHHHHEYHSHCNHEHEHHEHDENCGCGHDHTHGNQYLSSINAVTNYVHGKSTEDIKPFNKDLKNLATDFFKYIKSSEDKAQALGLAYGLAITSAEELYSDVVSLLLTQDNLNTNQDFINSALKIAYYIQHYSYTEFFFLNDFFVYFLDTEHYSTESGAKFYSWFLSGYLYGATYGIDYASKILKAQGNKQSLLKALETSKAFLEDILSLSTLTSNIAYNMGILSQLSPEIQESFNNCDLKSAIEITKNILNKAEQEYQEANNEDNHTKKDTKIKDLSENKLKEEDYIKLLEQNTLTPEQHLSFLRSLLTDFSHENAEVFFILLEDLKKAVQFYRAGKEIKDLERPDLTTVLSLIVPEPDFSE